MFNRNRHYIAVGTLIGVLAGAVSLGLMVVGGLIALGVYLYRKANKGEEQNKNDENIRTPPSMPYKNQTATLQQLNSNNQNVNNNNIQIKTTNREMLNLSSGNNNNIKI